MRIRPVLVLVGLLAGCGSGGGGGTQSPPLPSNVSGLPVLVATSTTVGTMPPTSASAPATIAIGGAESFGLVYGSMPASISAVSSNPVCATATITGSGMAYSANVIVPAAASSGCTATIVITAQLPASTSSQSPIFIQAK